MTETTCPNLQDLVKVRERLDAVVIACERLVKEDTHVSVSMQEVISLARKITPSVIPPAGLRFNPDSGPVEGLPSRFRMPFPNQDEMRLSVVALEGNKTAAVDVNLSASPSPKASPQVAPVSFAPSTRIVEEPLLDEDDDDEFRDEFD